MSKPKKIQKTISLIVALLTILMTKNGAYLKIYNKILATKVLV